MIPPKEKAIEIVEMFSAKADELQENTSFSYCKECALICVKYTITSNPHSNPFNTDVHSTMDYWQQVKTEIEKL